MAWRKAVTKPRRVGLLAVAVLALGAHQAFLSPAAHPRRHAVERSHAAAASAAAIALTLGAQAALAEIPGEVGAVVSPSVKGNTALAAAAAAATSSDKTGQMAAVQLAAEAGAAPAAAAMAGAVPAGEEYTMADTIIGGAWDVGAGFFALPFWHFMPYVVVCIPLVRSLGLLNFMDQRPGVKFVTQAEYDEKYAGRESRYMTKDEDMNPIVRMQRDGSSPQLPTKDSPPGSNRS